MEQVINFDNKGACVFGLPDSGKSTFTSYMLSQYGGGAFVYDTLGEYPDAPMDSYQPRDRYSVPEFERIIRKAAFSGRYRLIVMEEANRFCPSKPAPLPQAVADLNDWRAHYDLSTVYICRRPVQLNQDLTELAPYLFIFRLTGKNDRQYLNDIADGLGDAAAALHDYHFLAVAPDRHYSVCLPVPKEFATNKKINSKVQPLVQKTGENTINGT